MEVTVDTQNAALVLHEIPDHAGRASVRAQNRAIASARTFMTRAIAADIGLKAKDVREALRMTQASLQRPFAALAAGLKRIALYKFGAKGPVPSRGKGRGVTYKIGAGGRSRVERAFIASM